MRRLVVVTTAVAALIALAVPAFAATTVNVPRKYSGKLAHVRKASGVPVLLPTHVRVDVSASRVFGAVERARSGQYDLSLGIGRSCHGADACFVAEFFAKRGARPAIKRRVALAHGIQGRFRPITCGASCAAAEIEWVQSNVLYDIQYKGSKRQLKELANSAIRAGAR